MPAQFKGHELFVSRLYDGLDAALYRGRTVVTSFFTPAEQAIAQSILKDVSVFWTGGYPDAERQLAVFSADPLLEKELESWVDLVCLHAHLDRPGRPLRHPDVLGALLHAGIARERIGDILCTENDIYLFCKEGMADFIRENIRIIGRQSLLFEPCHPREVPRMPKEEIRVNVSSLRYDAVIAALAHTSRSKAADMIRQGNVKINDVVLEENGKLCYSDFVSIRRCGRFRYLGIEKTTRKDRMFLIFQKYS